MSPASIVIVWLCASAVGDEGLRWEPVGDDAEAAVRAFVARMDDPLLRAYRVDVDLAGDVELVVAASPDDDRLETPTEFASRLGAVAVINAGYFGGRPPRPIGYLRDAQGVVSAPLGSVKRGEESYAAARGAFGLRTDGAPDVAWIAGRSSEVVELIAPPDNSPGRPARLEVADAAPWPTRCAVQAGPVLIHDGEVVDVADAEVFFGAGIDGRHPRSAIGYRTDQTVVLLVIDGRQEMSRGATLEETARILHDLGCVEALNLDGGGSSAIVCGERLNRPLGGEVERPVASVIAVVPARPER